MTLARPLSCLPLVAAACLLGPGIAAGQDGDLSAQIEAAQQRYEEAWTGGDIEALVELHTEDAVVWPGSGGSFEGRDAVRGYFEQAPRPESFDARSERTERLGEFVLDVGTYSGSLAAEAGGGPLDGEYVVIARPGEDGLKIHRLLAFPPRREPSAAPR